MVKVKLYYAEWCGHCKNFKPTWDALKPMFKENNIEYAEFSDEQNEQEIADAGVEGFPTIRIEKDNMEYDYSGGRDVNSIIAEVLPHLQLGGGTNKKYIINYTF